MTKYRITTTQVVTKVSHLIESTNKEGAKNKWMEQGCPTAIEDLAGEIWAVEEIEGERIDETYTDSYTTGADQLPE